MSFNTHEISENNNQLWERFRNGDVEAFGNLSQLNYKALYNYGLRFSPDTEFVKDCIQDLYLDLWERRSYLSETSFVKFYLMKALRHRIIKESLHLKRFREPETIPFELYETGTPWEKKRIEEESLQLQIDLVKKSIAQLSKRQKEIIYLRYYQNMNYDQIAIVMNISRASVATLHYRTLQKMKNQNTIRDLFLFVLITLN